MPVSTAYGDRELTVSRLLEFSRDTVFRAWIDPRLALRWWGPEEHPATFAQIDLRPGGAWSARFTMRDEGRELRAMGIIHEIIPCARIIYTFAWEENGDRGLDTLATLTFIEEAPFRTRVTVHQRPFRLRHERDDYLSNWADMFNRFEACLTDAQSRASTAGKQYRLAAE